MNPREHNSLLRNFSWEFLLRYRINELPVKPTRLLKYHNTALYSYEKYADYVGAISTYPVADFNKDGFVFYSHESKKFILCYNEKKAVEVCRWTVMHELSHVVLGHISPRRDSLGRVRGNAKKFIEKEADIFTRRILCPSIVLHCCHTIEPDAIKKLCGVSIEAAQYRSKHMKRLEKRNLYSAHPLEQKVKKQFLPFINLHNKP